MIGEKRGVGEHEIQMMGQIKFARYSIKFLARRAVVAPARSSCVISRTDQLVPSPKLRSTKGA